MAALLLMGGDSSHDHHTIPKAPAPANTAFFETDAVPVQAPPASPLDQYDIAARFVGTAFNEQVGLDGPVKDSLPAGISDPALREVAIQAVELETGAEAVLQAGDYPVSNDTLESVARIQDTCIRKVTKRGIAAGIYADTVHDVLGLDDEDASEAAKRLIAKRQLFFEGLLKVGDHKVYRTYIGRLTALAVLSDRMFSRSDKRQRVETEKQLRDTWIDAVNRANIQWMGLQTKADTAGNRIMNRTLPGQRPKTVRIAVCG